MVEFPAPDRIDLGTFALVVGLLVLGYVVYPRHLVQVAVWYSIVMIFVCWTGYFVYKLAFDEVEFWE